MDSKKRHSAEEKVHILRDYLEHQLPISEVSERYKVSPGNIYNWRKQLFEEGTVVFQKNKTEVRQTQQLEARIAELEATLASRENVISELASEVIQLKKKTTGASSLASGLSRKSVTKS
jgi:transposase-like protein